MIERTKDEEAVDRAVERFARKSVPHRRLTKRVLRAQSDLQRLVSKRAWFAYLKLEEVVGERHLGLFDAAIRIALRRRRLRSDAVRR
jgi:hypothetical protein